MTDDYQGPTGGPGQALAIYLNFGDRGGEAEVLNEAGKLHRISGKPAEAEAYHWQALKRARAIVSTRDEAHALAGLGRYAAALSRIMRAKTLLWPGTRDIPSGSARLTPAPYSPNSTPSPGSKE